MKNQKNMGVKHHSTGDRALPDDIRLADLADLDALVAIHLRAFPGFFLTLLGPRFLTELYRGFLSAESGLCCVAERDGTVVGFVVGTTEPTRFFKKLFWSRGLFFLLAAAPALIWHPLIIGRKLLAALTYRGESPTLDGRGALLSSLAVCPDIARQGEGSALVQAFYQSAGSRSARFVYLTTDSEQNDRVNAFYQKLGFGLHSQYEKSGGRRMNCYVLDTAFGLAVDAKLRVA